MKIRSRFLLFLFTFFLTVLAVGLSVQYASYRLFTNYLYGTITEIFHSSVGSFTTSVENLEKLSITILSDERTQSFLKNEPPEADEFRWSRERDKFIERQNFYLRTNDYIKEILTVNGSGNSVQANSGAYGTALPSPSERGAIRKKTLRLKGGALWSVTDSVTAPLILSRQINYIGEFNKPPLGFLYLFIDMDKLVTDNFTQIKYYGLETVIYHRSSLIYSSLDGDESLITKRLGEASYDTLRYRGETYFSTRAKTRDAIWEFIFLVPASEMFDRFNSLNRIGIILYLGLLLIFILLTLGFSRRITSPIISLSREMMLMEDRDFQSDDPLELDPGASEEVALLYHEFYQMMDRIDTLINKNLKQQLSLNQSRLEALSHQLNPHFLYNTLDSLYWMAEESGQSEMAGVVKALSTLLRSSLSKGEPLITLKEQLDLLNDYFHIQQIRFKERLEYSLDVDFHLYQTLIPRFTLQPLVENAIKYSLEESHKHCLIEVSIKETPSGGMKILVRDNGPGLINRKKVASGSTGIGLENLKGRLSLLYGNRAELTIKESPSGGTDVCLFIPPAPEEAP